MLQIFLEQKKMLKTGLNIARFREQVRVIEAETIEYFQRWGDSGEKSKILHKSLDSNMNILFFQFVLISLTHTQRSKCHNFIFCLFQTCLRLCLS